MARMDKVRATLRSLWYGVPATNPEAVEAAAESQRATGPLGVSRLAWVIAGAVVLVALLVLAVAWVQDQRADDRRADAYYCTLSGVGPFDRAPNTGERCIDLMED